MSSALDDIFASAMTRRLSPGQSLFSVGDPVKVMIRVNFGAVALRRVTEQGTVLTLHVARRGEVLAEASLHSAHYHCEAAAREASEVALLPTHEFRDALRRDDDLVEIWVRILSRTVQETRMRAEIRTIRTVSMPGCLSIIAFRHAASCKNWLLRLEPVEKLFTGNFPGAKKRLES